MLLPACFADRLKEQKKGEKNEEKEESLIGETKIINTAQVTGKDKGKLKDTVVIFTTSHLQCFKNKSKQSQKEECLQE